MVGKTIREGNLQARLARLEAEVEPLKEGVANFRNFQTEARKFFDQHDAREQERKKVDAHRARIHYALLTAALTLLVGICVAMFQMWAGGHRIVSNSPPIANERIPQEASVPTMRK